ncbi:MAG: CoA-binding protein, partial [Proteobacteria bacterium]|nr:CoA-binding protein [Pseudomonadota bacterium]
NLYPVNPKGGTISGLKIYRSIDEIPGSIDFAIIAVPAQKVPDALESCRKKGAVGAEILSSGFSEVATPEGFELDRQIKEIAAKGIRVIGPNCFGIYCPKSGLTMLPGPDLSREAGAVAFLSQSGGLSIDFAYLGKWRGIRFSKMVSFGNGCDLRETEMLEYLRCDPETKVICLYIEGVKDGRKFFKVLSDTTMEKPVIVMKGGLSDAGGRAVASHTASMGGSHKIWKSALRQSNAVQVENLQEMSDMALAFSMLPLQEYKGMTVIGGGGALGVNATDMADKMGLSTPPLRTDIQEKIRQILPQPGSSPANPIDIANPFVPPQILKETILHASGDGNIQIHIMIQLLHSYKSLASNMGENHMRKVTPIDSLVTACSSSVTEGGKPLVMILPNYKQELEAMDIEEVIREVRKKLLSTGIPVFDRVKDALKTIAAISLYEARRKAIY